MVAGHAPVAEEETAWVARVAAELARRGLMTGEGPPTFEPLTGGVSSDIWMIRQGDRKLVVKRALAKLNVAQEWRAPVSRNAADAEWLRAAGRIVPGSVPQVLYEDAAAGLFVMSYIEPAQAPVWKARLLAGDVDVAFAAAVGRTIGRIHAATAGRPEVAATFPNAAAFHALRLAPYLEATAEKHPALASRILAIARTTADRQECLIHGDVSPKNILVGARRPGAARRRMRHLRRSRLRPRVLPQPSAPQEGWWRPRRRARLPWPFRRARRRLSSTRSTGSRGSEL